MYPYGCALAHDSAHDTSRLRLCCFMAVWFVRQSEGYCGCHLQTLHAAPVVLCSSKDGNGLVLKQPHVQRLVRLAACVCIVIAMGSLLTTGFLLKPLRVVEFVVLRTFGQQRCPATAEPGFACVRGKCYEGFAL